MTDMFDKEAELRRQLLMGDALPNTIPEPPVVDKIITTVVRQAHVQTAGLDLLVLAVSSFFAFVLVFFAPIVANSAAKKGRTISGSADKDGLNRH